MGINISIRLPWRSSKEWLFLLAWGHWDSNPCWVTTISCTVMCIIKPQHVWCCGRGMVCSIPSAVACLQYKFITLLWWKKNFWVQNLQHFVSHIQSWQWWWCWKSYATGKIRQSFSCFFTLAGIIIYFISHFTLDLQYALPIRFIVSGSVWTTNHSCYDWI